MYVTAPRSVLAAFSLVLALVAACGGDEGEAGDGDAGSSCGPTTGTVLRVVDGDTLELVSGERIRYLLVDTPESTTEQECFGEEAKEFNRDLVEGQEVSIRYDVDCADRFDRLLAYVSVGGREVNRLLVERGFACVLQIDPNGVDRVSEYQELETAARVQSRGLWGACEGDLPC